MALEINTVKGPLIIFLRLQDMMLRGGACLHKEKKEYYQKI
jgi:hypothetical protein